MKERKIDFNKIRFGIGIVVVITFVIIFVYFIFDKTGKEMYGVYAFSEEFLTLMKEGKYQQAINYVDTSRISLDEIKEISDLATHYSSSGTYGMKSSNNIYIAGFKPDSFDSDNLNNEILEFWIGKVNGKWKVINVNSRLGHPLIK